MIQGKHYSFPHPSQSLSPSSRNLVTTTGNIGGGSWKESYLHMGNPSSSLANSYEMEETGNRILFMDPSQQNDDDDDQGSCSVIFEKEHMFDKVVTPSDVGKLNRLVIPKQHAEKYFPLDSSTCEKGLLLNFEDRTGKPWRFRYSYWNSSQSYVMTKGWSRFVKEMKLDAGDIVSFQRGVGELAKDRLFIDWRRRPSPPQPPPVAHNHLQFLPRHFLFGHSIPWDPSSPPALQDYLRVSRTNERPSIPHQNRFSGAIGHSHDYGYGHGYGDTPTAVTSSNYGVCDMFYLRSSTAIPQTGMGETDTRGSSGEGGSMARLPVEIYDSVPVVQGKAAAKRFRLFGVNMEYPASDANDTNSQPSAPSQLVLYDGVPVTPTTQFISKGKASVSLDLDI